MKSNFLPGVFAGAIIGLLVCGSEARKVSKIEEDVDSLQSLYVDYNSLAMNYKIIFDSLVTLKQTCSRPPLTMAGQ